MTGGVVVAGGALVSTYPSRDFFTGAGPGDSGHQPAGKLKLKGPTPAAIWRSGELEMKIGLAVLKSRTSII